MNTRLGLLVGLLAVQISLAVLLVFGGSNSQSESTEMLLEYDVAEVDELQVHGEDGKTVTLSKVDGRWFVGGDVPADGDKIAGILEKFAAMPAPWPVGNSASVRERFEVTEDKYQRKVQLKQQDDSVAEFYLGTSPGYRQVHARTHGSDSVYSIDFANHELPLNVDDWLARDLLSSNGEPTSVALDGKWTLTKSEEGWLIREVDGEDQAADPDAAGDLINRLKDLRVTGTRQPTPAEDDSDEPTLKGMFQITDDEGVYALELFQGTEEDDYFLESDRYKGQYTLAAYIAEQLIVDADSLVRRGEEADSDAQVEASDSAADSDSLDAS